jgi:RNA polymerase sigma-70 factor (ECF subfamily)
MTHTNPQLDPALLARARLGEDAAHEAVYRAFSPMVFTLARRMLASHSLAEDVLQDTFVAVLLNIATFRDDVALGAWIKRIAINRCLSHLRSAWSVRRVIQGDVELGSSYERNRAEDQLALERALDALPDPSRAVVWLHDVEGYTHKEIGALMGRSTSFSKSQLARAHERLRVSLDGALDDSALPLCTHALKIC